MLYKSVLTLVLFQEGVIFLWRIPYFTKGTSVDNTIQQWGVLTVSKFIVIQLELYYNEADIFLHGRGERQKKNLPTNIVQLDFQSTMF